MTLYLSYSSARMCWTSPHVHRIRTLYRQRSESRAALSYDTCCLVQAQAEALSRPLTTQEKEQLAQRPAYSRREALNEAARVLGLGTALPSSYHTPLLEEAVTGEPAQLPLLPLAGAHVPAPYPGEETRLANAFGLPLPLHVSVPCKNARRMRNTLTCHVHPICIPITQYVASAVNVFVASPELTLLQAAANLPASRSALVELAVLCSEFFAAYVTDPGASSGLVRRTPISSIKRCQSFLARCGKTKGKPLFKRALGLAVEHAASPPELAMALLAGTPRHLGGYGLGKPLLNHSVETGRATGARAARHRLCDLYWPKHRIAVEYYGRVAHEGQAFVRDAERAAELSAAGVHTLVLSFAQLADFGKLEQFMVDTLARKLKRRDRKTLDAHAALRSQFHAEVLRLLNLGG